MQSQQRNGAVRDAAAVVSNQEFIELRLLRETGAAEVDEHHGATLVAARRSSGALCGLRLLAAR
jgi:hypothetical protein